MKSRSGRSWAPTSHISEAWLMPVLEAMLAPFPFRIRGFHSDNGSEFVNHTVAGMLNKLLIEQTKSRPRHSNDNGLVESKKGAVIRKHMEFDHIAADRADQINVFFQEHFNPYLNFHRPCGVPQLKKDCQGKTRRTYKWYATPWKISPSNNWNGVPGRRAIPVPRAGCSRKKQGFSRASHRGEARGPKRLRK